MLSLLGTIAVAIHMLAGKQLLKHISAFVYNFLVFAVAATSLAVYNAICGLPFTGYAPREWGIFLLLAIVPTLFGHYLFNWLMKYLSASAVSMAVLGEPVFASLLAWLLLKESLSALQLSAGALILCGVWIFIRYGKETTNPERKSPKSLSAAGTGEKRADRERLAERKASRMTEGKSKDRRQGRIHDGGILGVALHSNRRIPWRNQAFYGGGSNPGSKALTPSCPGLRRGT